MAKLNTWGFFKKLGQHTLKGDPLAIVDDLAESAREADAKDEKKDREAIETEGTSNEKA